MHPPPFMTPPNPLHTPMQAGFFPHAPGAPGRPPMHRSSPSVAQLAAAGILPPGMPMTPMGQNGFPSPMFGLSPYGPAFVPRSKRAASMSVGGPPKAVLGGPQRKVSPLPPAAPVATPSAPTAKPKKVVVNFPKETIPAEGDAPLTRRPWARTPLSPSSIPEQSDVPLPEISTAELYPSDTWRYHLPATIDVYLPGKSTWAEIKRRLIEEKLERLGVEPGSGSSVPHIHAPHARAASISSPADPALLYFKLNKLQQSQKVSSPNPLSASPQPPFNLSPSPNSVPPRFQGRHGHSMSLAQPPSFQPRSPVYNPAAAFNPFGPSATLGSDQIFTHVSPVPVPTASVSVAINGIHAPQGRVPANLATLVPSLPLSRPESRPDFMRGFGLDVTKEEEEPEEEPVTLAHLQEDTAESVVVESATQEDAVDADQDGTSTVSQTRIHSRHTSHLSAALSLRSVGGVEGPSFGVHGDGEAEPARGSLETEGDDADAVGEWTGSEDMRTGAEISEDESIGEWSNPSDEERARQQRLERRILRRAKQQAQRDPEVPRRLPNFPRPPDIAPTFVDTEDIVSNPSEEGHAHAHDAFAFDHRAHFPRPSSGGHSRPLPPLPEARPGSAPYSYHDPALAHSREGSEQFAQLGGLHPRPSQASPLHAEALNPLAKPFVFGQSRVLSVLAEQAPQSMIAPTAPAAPLASGHTRVPSIGKPLNAAAQEFKPVGFTFRPPPGVPQLTFTASSQVSRPLPTPPAAAITSPGKVASGRETQGREKRQRRGSLDGEDEDGVSHMHSFKFPFDNARAVSAPVSPPANRLGLEDSSESAKAVTLPTIMHSPTDDVPGDENRPPSAGSVTEGGMIGSAELPFPPTMKPKRAPIPLDFKHPISTNTVPAGLFKALVNGDGDDRTRRSVRSRLSSRDVFEHSPRPSLDDLNVPPIAHRTPLNRLFTEPSFRGSSSRHSSATPDRPLHQSPLSLRRRDEDDEDDFSDAFDFPPVNLSRRIEMQQYEQRLQDILDNKFAEIEQALSGFKASGGQSLSTSTEAMMSEVISLFRAQLQDSAAKGLEDSQMMDARGELDLEILKGIIDQKHAESRALLQRDISQILDSRNQEANLVKLAQDLTNRTVETVVSATSQLGQHLQHLERPTSAVERDTTVRDVINALMPQLATLRPEPIDYESLTARLTQAVKPHISQLIDLASDKRETAGLIVDRLLPILPSLLNPEAQFDADVVITRLTAEVRKVVAPLDAHEIKEQVSDLVVERLDSRLAVRDRAFNVDTIIEKILENMRELLAPVQEIQTAVAELGRRSQESSEPSLDLSSIRQDILNTISDLPQQLLFAKEALTNAQLELKNRLGDQTATSTAANVISQIESVIHDIAREQQGLISQNKELSDFCQEIVRHIETLPEAMLEATQILQNAHADFSAQGAARRETEEVRRLMAANADMQVQLAKARGAHGQIRVEKDMLDERMRNIESDRDRLLSKVEELQESVSSKTADATAAESKNAELEEALARALERLKAADVHAQTNSTRIAQLEASNRDLAIEKEQFKSQFESLELRVTFITREKETIADELSMQRKYNETLISEQNHWDELRRASEQIQTLANLVGQTDGEELQELRRTRDRSKVMEGEHAALQRRLKEYETKMATNEKLAQASRQSLAQAQQRAAEWEKHAKEYETELSIAQTKLHDVEQAHTQLEADYQLAKLHLDERDAEERLDKDRQSKLRDQIAALEAQVARLQAETDQAKKTAASATSLQSNARYQNGHGRTFIPPRSASRASTVYGESRSGTPNAHLNGSHASITGKTTPQPSVWDSIHAPRPSGPISMPQAKRSSSYYRSPSPTPSNVSAAPTLGDDGWWS
ncbi:uncharacterized protein LAESUDRAFT_647961 [Laetiporus sulphureus 93-53]|uniref:Uncharacterized protein n=1 Tax=Laetiporus sulphureus 93-53 TaxID=1314785 RepID=A0A165FGI8_9APHY|nr:uncharacterized protein LAESUDRAFT_647961 [Laetiporus sulphureus 93-53]KZT08936.1 hypothetical protein LAESUDRAFT_647961 [Laetiporus sulphureus 93-53]